MTTSRRLALATCALLTIPLAACDDSADSGPQTASVRSDLAVEFIEEVDLALTDAGTPVDDTGGGVSAPCFVLDDQAVRRLGASLGMGDSASLDDPSRVYGTAGHESLQCDYAIAGLDQAPPPSLLVVTTDGDLDDFVASLDSLDDPPDVIEHDADGLDDDAVTGLERDGFRQAVWVDGGLRVTVGARVQDADLDDLFNALSVAVTEVERILLSR